MKLILLFSFLALSSCSSPQKEAKNLNAFFDKSFKESLALSPEYQTYLGSKENYGKLDDISEEMSKKELELAKKQLAELREFNFKSLKHDEKISYRIFEEQLKESIEGYPYRYHHFPVSQMFGRHTDLPSFMINMHQIDSYQDAKDYIWRLKEFKPNFATLIENLEIRRRENILAPKFVYPKVIKEAVNIVSGKPFPGKGKSPLYTDFEEKIKKLKLSDEERSRLMKELNDALKNSVGPAYLKLIATLRELEKIAPQEVSASSLPNGENYYKRQLEEITTTEMTAEEIHQLGLSEAKRIQAEMKEILTQLGFKGSLQDFFKFLRTSPKFKYSNDKAGREKYYKDTEKILEKMKNALPQMFGRLPEAKVVVKPVESYREASAPQAFYQGPSEEGKRPGIYYINLHNMDIVTKYEQEALAYHEALPGHHLQIAIAQELDDLPAFRKHGGYTAFTEGWGLYAEYFPKEFGFYKDPYSNFGRLTMELWRAGRLVVDTGLHHKNWTMKEAVEWLDKNTPKPHSENVTDVQRYIVMPGQATAYKIGMLKILSLREMAKKALKEKFDIKEFHDRVLGDGALPLDILEEKIKAWIQEIKNQ